MAVSENKETLLHGALAVEKDHADREAAVRALDAWARDPSRSIIGYLDEQGIRNPDVRARVEEAVRIELLRHGDGPSQDPAALATVAGTLGSLVSPGHPAAEDDPMASPVDRPRPPVEELPLTAEADPFATLVEPHPDLLGSVVHEGGEIDPIWDDLRHQDDLGPTGPGSILTPDLSPLSSIDIPSWRTGGSGSELPRFDPTATPDPDARSPQGFDSTASTGVDQIVATERDTNATELQTDGHHHNPLVTSAVGMEATAQGYLPSSGSAQEIGAFGYSGTSSSRFKVVRLHAKGGLGSVLVAYDEELRREVALKEIQERHADNPDSRARFLLEAEITGGLEHPGVVPVYSLGSNPDGRPYYAMRFIRGESLRRAIEAFHDPERGPKDPGDRAIQLRALLRRFIDVCNAMEYAHSRGVIHRDIKPDNIMLGPYGETLLVDWGLAKALDRVEVPSKTEEMPLRPASGGGSTPTLDGSAIGTPAYMSPEQAEGDLARMGPPSDVYSLGATLYQILTGSPPFTERNLFQILIKVRSGDFPPPRQLKPEIPPALEAICLTAMARSVEDRYDSCRALADDLEKWLADEPVSVYVEPWIVRLGRWAKRHRTLVTSAGVLLLTAVVGLSVGAILLKRERDRTELARQDAVAGWEEARLNEAEANAQREEAEQNAELARVKAIEAEENARIADANRLLAEENEALAVEQRRIAEANFQSAVEAVDALLTEVGEIDLADVPQMEQTRRDLLLKARDFYATFLDRNKGPETLRNAGRAHSRLGDIHELLGEYPEALNAYVKARDIQEPLVEANPDDPDLAADLARTRHNLGVLMKKLNEFEDAEDLLEQARSTRADLLERDPDSFEAKSDLAASIYQLGAVNARLVGGRHEARDLYERAIALQREVVEGRHGLEEDRRELARYLNNLALLIQGTAPGEADAAFEEATALQRLLAERNTDVPHYSRELARTLNNRVRDAIVNDPDAAEPHVREAITLADRLSRDFPTVPEYWSELGGYQRNLGRILTERGNRMDDQEAAAEAKAVFTQAEGSFRKAEEIRAQLAETYPTRPEFRHRLALVRHDLAAFLRGSNQPEEARTFLEPAIETLRSLTERYPDVPEYPKDLALALSEQAYATLAEEEGLARGLGIAQEGLRHAEAASADRPDDAVYWESLMTLHKQVGWFLLTRGTIREAVDHAMYLAEHASGSPRWLFAAAELYIRSFEAVGGDQTINREDFESLKQDYLDAAGRNLEAAAEAGFRSSKLADDAFGPYRDREPFGRALEAIRDQAQES